MGLFGPGLIGFPPPSLPQFLLSFLPLPSFSFLLQLCSLSVFLLQNCRRSICMWDTNPTHSLQVSPPIPPFIPSSAWQKCRICCSLSCLAEFLFLVLSAPHPEHGQDRCQSFPSRGFGFNHHIYVWIQFGVCCNIQYELRVSLCSLASDYQPPSIICWRHCSFRPYKLFFDAYRFTSEFFLNILMVYISVFSHTTFLKYVNVTFLVLIIFVKIGYVESLVIL